jgi:hypothetical protein
MEYPTNCVFSTPLYVLKTGDVITLVPPTGTNQNFQYSQMNCTTSNPVVLQISDGTNTAYISQSWDFGILFIAFLLVFGIFVIVAREIFLFLFHQYVAIIRSKKFPPQ